MLDTRLPNAWTRLARLSDESFLPQEPSELSLGAHHHEQHAYTVEVAHGPGNRMLPFGSGLLLHVCIGNDLETPTNARACMHVWVFCFSTQTL